MLRNDDMTHDRVVDDLTVSATTGSSRTSAAREQPLTPAQAKTVEENIALVRHIVSRVTERFPLTEDRDDLMQAGLLGLVEATKRFDPELGFNFSTFAGRRVEGAVLDSLRRSDWAPRSLRRHERVLQDADASLTASLHRKPNAEELSAATGLPAKKVRELQLDLSRLRVDSLFQGTGYDDDSDEMITDPPDREARPLSGNLEHRELLAYLRDGIHLLPERHRMIIVGHFLEGRSMTELGETLGVTQSRASQLKSDALEILRVGMSVAIDETPSNPDASRRQKEFNEAIVSESSPYERLGVSSRMAAVS